MPLIVSDKNASAQNLPNTGIDTVYYYNDPGTITTTATSATDVYQFKGAAGVVCRLRKIEMIASTIQSAVTFVGTTTLARLLRRSTAGTTGTWTAATFGSTLGIAASTFAATAAGPSTTLNIAGTTAFTVGTGQGLIRTGYIGLPWSGGATSFVPGVPLVWLFGVLGNGPCTLTGTSDYVVVNLNGVTPLAALQTNFEFEEATF